MDNVRFDDRRLIWYTHEVSVNDNITVVNQLLFMKKVRI